jgi:hypothetical protein
VSWGVLEPRRERHVPLLERTASYATRERLLVVSLVGIALVAAGLRMVGTNWDAGAHLHPDERYISTVADNTDLPASLRDYFDVGRSPLSPYNIEQGRDYLYGQLPLTATKLVATAVGEDRYGELNIVGRRLAALLDTLTTVLVFFIARALLVDRGKRGAVAGGLLAAALYAVTVTAIQHAHFFTTDVWVVFFSTLTMLLALRSLRVGVDRHARNPAPVVFLVGASFGLTMACKISGGLVAVPVALALLGRALLVSRWAGRRAAFVRLLAESGIALAVAYLAFRLVSPYTFASSNWLDISLNESFRASVEAQARNVAGPSAFPPSYQWQLSSPVWAPLENLALWQLGVPLALAALVGLLVLGARIAGDARAWMREAATVGDAAVVRLASFAMVVSYVAAVFLYFATPFVHSGRYLLPMIPLLPVAAVLAVAELDRRAPRAAVVVVAVVVGTTTVYALGFTHVYREPNTRVAASAWIAENVPPGSFVANEHWDDALPIGGPWGVTKQQALELDGYRGVEVAVYNPDDERKVRDLYRALARADYYVLSSPRAWNSIGRLESQFPLMPRFYDQLFAERLGFDEAAEFSSYPEVLGVSIPDRRAEEAFWVYDHPQVRIFERDRPLEWESFRSALCPAPAPPYCT